jgi:hypothetical protein
MLSAPALYWSSASRSALAIAEVKLRGIGSGCVASPPRPPCFQGSLHWHLALWQCSCLPFLVQDQEIYDWKYRKEIIKCIKILGGAFLPCLIPGNTKTRQQCEYFSLALAFCWLSICISTNLLIFINPTFVTVRSVRSVCLINFNIHV